MSQAQQTTSPADTAGSAADEAAIRELVAKAQQFQNEPTPFLALHTADASIVNIAGRRVLGREALAAAMGQALASPLAKVITRTEIEGIRFIRPDVAIVNCRKLVDDQREQAGAGSLPSAGSLTYVVVREAADWRISLAQTTPVATMSDSHDGRGNCPS